mmetsp:Transcript_128151/g.246908  ORF Transcript_128151/g.246908 Transcript_128151/m.246908 type:complete len:272 (-) Transcript_128151:1005-1820(-)
MPEDTSPALQALALKSQRLLRLASLLKSLTMLTQTMHGHGMMATKMPFHLCLQLPAEGFSFGEIPGLPQHRCQIGLQPEEEKKIVVIRWVSVPEVPAAAPAFIAFRHHHGVQLLQLLLDSYNEPLLQSQNRDVTKPSVAHATHDLFVDHLLIMLIDGPAGREVDFHECRLHGLKRIKKRVAEIASSLVSHRETETGTGHDSAIQLPDNPRSLQSYWVFPGLQDNHCVTNIPNCLQISRGKPLLWQLVRLVVVHGEQVKPQINVLWAGSALS